MSTWPPGTTWPTTPSGSGVTWPRSGSSPTPPTFTADSPPGGTVGTAYTYTFTATGTAPIAFAVTSGTLPTGLTLNGVTGVLSGTPTASGPFSFVVTASNGNLPNAVSPTINMTIAANVVRVSAHDAIGGASATFAGTPTPGNLLLCCVLVIGAAPTIAGWNQVVTQLNTSTIRITLFSRISNGTEGTVTPSASLSISLCEYAGATAATDGTPAGNFTATGVTNLVTAAITTTIATSLLFVVAYVNAADTAPGFSGGGPPTTILANATVNLMWCGQYLPGTTQTGYTTTCTSSGIGGDFTNLIAGFKAA